MVPIFFFQATDVQAEQPQSLHRISAFVGGGPGGVGLGTDGHGPRLGQATVGAGASYMLGGGRGRGGLGLRYDFLPGGETNWSTGDTETAHLLSAVLLVALVIPISRAGDEFSLVASIGPTWGWLLAQPPEYVEDGTTLRVAGFSLEATLGFAHPVVPAADWIAEAGARLGSIHASNGASYFEDASGVYPGLFFRTGVRFEP